MRTDIKGRKDKKTVGWARFNPLRINWVVKGGKRARNRGIEK